MTKVQINQVLNEQFPNYIRDNYQKFIEFLQQYYISQEYEGGSSDLIQNLSDYISADTFSDPGFNSEAFLSQDIDFYDDEIFSTSILGWPNEYGLLKIDDEIISYTGISTSQQYNAALTVPTSFEGNISFFNANNGIVPEIFNQLSIGDSVLVSIAAEDYDGVSYYIEVLEINGDEIITTEFNINFYDLDKRVYIISVPSNRLYSSDENLFVGAKLYVNSPASFVEGNISNLYSGQLGVEITLKSVIIDQSFSSNIAKFEGCQRGFGALDVIGQNYQTLTNSSTDKIEYRKTEAVAHVKGTQIFNLTNLFKEEIFKGLKKTFAPGFENRELYGDLDKGNFLRQISDLYKSKGSKESYELLFRFLYGKDVSINDNYEEVIRPSDSVYVKGRYVTLEPVTPNINTSSITNTTLEQPNYIGYCTATTAVIASATVSFFDDKKYIQVFLTNETVTNPNIQTDVSNLFITPPQTLLTAPYRGESFLTVESTIGFVPNPSKENNILLLTRKSDGFIYQATYESASSTQFFGIKGIENETFEIGDSFEVDIKVYCYDQFNPSQKFEFKIKNVISDFNVTKNCQYNVVKEPIRVTSVGFIADKKEEVQYNSYIFNNAVTYDVSFVNYNSTTFVFELSTYTKNYFLIGDTVNIIENGKVITIGTVISNVDNLLSVQTDGLNVFGSLSVYQLQRNIKFAESDIWPEVKNYVANVQNNYKQKFYDVGKKHVTVFTNSLPSYKIETTDRSENFYGTGIRPTPFLTLPDTDFLTGDSVQFGKLNGYDINYYLATDVEKRGFKLDSSSYYIVEKVGISSIRLYNDRSSIEGGNYFIFFDNDSLGQFSLTPSRLFDTTLTGQNLTRFIPVNTEVGIRTSGSLYERKPGGIGLLGNGVELISNTSIFYLSYGSITNLNLIRGGEGYDVLNPPKLFVSPFQNSIEGTAVCNVGVTGSLQSIEVYSNLSGWLQIPAVYITGGGGFGAKAECILSGIATERRIEAVTVLERGEGYKNKPIYVDPQNIDVYNNFVVFNNHPFENGDIIQYKLSDPTQTPIGGLNQNQNYYVIYINQDKFSLAASEEDLRLKIPVTLKSSGSKYNIFNYEPITVTITGITGYGATSVSPQDIEVNFRGSITDGFIVEPGVGYGSSTIISYEKEPFVTVTSGDSAQIGVDAIVNGVITSVRIVNSGRNYTTVPTLRVIGDGTGAILTAIISNGEIVDVIIQSGGIGYNIQNTLVQVIPVGDGARLSASVQTWSIDLPSRHFDQLSPDWGFLRLPNNININNTSQYTTFLLPVQLRRQLGEPNLSDYGVQEALPYAHSPLVGWAYDGNPIYGPYGFSDAFDNNSPVKLLNSSYQFQPQPSRPEQFLINSGLGTTTGFFVEDWVYVDGYGELDIYNGRFCVTPEYPEGIYAYFATYQGRADIGYITVTSNAGLEYNISVEYSTRNLYASTNCLLNSGELEAVLSYNSYLIDKWNVWNNSSTILVIDYVLEKTEIPTSPVYPYVIGNYLRNQPETLNLVPTSTQDKVTYTNLIRNSWPYQLFNETNSYNFINYKQNLSQTSYVNSISSGIITGFDITKSGFNYKVGNALKFDNTETGGGGASGRVETVSTVPIEGLTYQSRELALNLAYKAGTVIGMTSTPHLLRNNQYVTIEDISSEDFSFIQGSYKVSVNDETSQLMYPLGDVSQTGIITTISLSNDPKSINIENNTILGIGTGETINVDLEQLLVINVYPTQNSIRVIRGYNGSNTVGFASTGTQVRVLSNTFEYQTGFTTSLIANNNTVIYFEPDVTTAIGSSIFNLVNHGYSAGQRLVYSPTAPNESGISPIIVNNQGTLLPLNSIPEIYVNYLSKDSFSLSTTPLERGTLDSPSILQITNLGSDSWQHNFNTTFVQLTGSGQVYTGIITTQTPNSTQKLNLTNTINLVVEPIETETVYLSFGSTSNRLFAGISAFTSSDVTISTDFDGLITIPSHGLKTGDVVEYYSDFEILTDTSDGKLLNFQQYFVIFVDNNTLALAESFLSATEIPPNKIGFLGILGSGSGTLSIVNPKINVSENSIIILDVSDVSFNEASFGLKEKILNIYRDQYFTEILNPFGDEFGTVAINHFGEPGQIGAYVSVNTQLISSRTLYYRLDSTPLVQVVYESALQPYLNTINSTPNFYNGTYNLVYVNSDGSEIQFSLPGMPPVLRYDQVNTRVLTFSVNEDNVLGSIASLSLVSAGSNFKALPGYSLVGGTAGDVKVNSTSIGQIEKVEIPENSYVYSTDPTLIPIGESPYVIELTNLQNVGLKTEFIPGEFVITDTFEGKIIDSNEDIPNYGWNKNNNQIIVTSNFGTLSIGQTITGRNSGTTATILSYDTAKGEFKLSSLSQLKGVWLDNIGLLNDNTQRIHDNDYYQIFAYNVESEIDYFTWNDPVSSLVHPLGYKKFGKLLITSTSELNLPTNIGESEISILSEASWYDYYDWDLAYDIIRNNIYVIARYDIYNPINNKITDRYYIQLTYDDNRLVIPERLGGDETINPIFFGGVEVFRVQQRDGAFVYIDLNDSPILINSIKTTSLPVNQDNFVNKIDYTLYYRSIKPGDSVQLIKFTPDNYPITQNIRNFRSGSGDFVVVTPLYDGPLPGIDTTGTFPRPMLWKKQKEDSYYEITTGYVIDPIVETVYQSKARPNYSANAFPSSQLIAPVSIGATEIFVKQNNPLFITNNSPIIDIFVSDPLNTRPGVGVTPFPEVGITTTIESVNVIGDYGQIVGFAQTDAIIQDASLGIGSFVVFQIKIDDSFIGAGITIPQLSVGDYFVTNYTNIGVTTCISYDVNNNNIVGVGTVLMDNVWQCAKICPDFYNETNSYVAICRGSIGTNPLFDLNNYLELEIELLNGTFVTVEGYFIKRTTPVFSIDVYVEVEQRNGNIVNATGVYSSSSTCQIDAYLDILQRNLNEVDVEMDFLSSGFTNGYFGNYSWGKFELANPSSVAFDVHYDNGLSVGLSTAPIASNIIPLI